MPARVVIIGGGIGGLSVAQRIRALAPDFDVRVFEREARVGGKIASCRRDGVLLEAGPNGFLDNEPASLRLVEELGLHDRLARSRDAARARFLVRDGRFHAIEMNPRRFLASPLLSRRAKLRMAMEYFIPARKDESDESVGAFGRRRLGREFTEIFLDSMVSGIYAGDVNTLSLRAAFPGMPVLERDYGGLFRALRAKQRARRQGKSRATGPAGPMGGVLYSFREGMQEVCDRLRERLGDCVQTNVAVDSIAPRERGWRVQAGARSLDCDAIVLATPAPDTARILTACAPESAHQLRQIGFSGIHVVYTVHRRVEVAHPVDGFGALIPRREQRRLLGTIWTHALFDDHAPSEQVVLRHMVGGAHDMAANQLSDDELVDLVLREARELYEFDTDPIAVHLFRWPVGIPQYTLGHLDRVRRARAALPAGLWLAGNSVAGIGFNHCVKHSEELAAELVGALRAQPSEVA
jgi:oxygen-dependent protoporphyrinogen oxidase